jgi:hypothetical protein
MAITSMFLVSGYRPSGWPAPAWEPFTGWQAVGPGPVEKRLAAGTQGGPRHRLPESAGADDSNTVAVRWVHQVPSSSSGTVGLPGRRRH